MVIVIALLALGAARRFAKRRSRPRARTTDLFAIADVVDLFGLACGAGLTVHAALHLVADHAPGSLGQALSSARDRSDAGERVADVLAELPRELGDAVRPLASVLSMAARYGTPVVPALERAAIELRVAQRRTMETQARRLPVKLLFPLVFCCLPAFALLTIAPLLITALSGLGGS